MQAEVSYKLKEILANQLNVPIENIKEGSLLANDLGADSLDIAEIALMIKEKFQYDLSDDEMKEIKTVSDVVEVLSLGLAKKNA